MDVSPVLFLTSFVAGALIFFAPCTMPLIPAYLAYLSGLAEAEVALHARGRILRHALAFVVGFGTTFTLFGVLAGFAGSHLGPLREVLMRAGGVLILVLGLFMLGLVSLPALQKARRVPAYILVAPGSMLASYGLGVLFAAGWTPCVGPVLATVLLLAGSTETAASGALLLATFSVGFAVPFILLAVAFERMTVALSRVTPFLHVVTRVGGALLVIVGLLFIFDRFDLVGQWSYRALDALNYEQYLLPYL